MDTIWIVFCFLQDCKVETENFTKAHSLLCCEILLLSIGSLGKDNSTGIVTKVVLDTAYLRETTNGLRIKTWQVMLFIIMHRLCRSDMVNLPI